MNELKTFTLDIFLIEDKELGGYSAFFAQFPNIMAEGENEEEAIKNLNVLVHDVFQHQKIFSNL